jgi:acyl-CoA thioesterase FadM
MEEYETYLGDGVYASTDGYQIWLAVNHHQNKVVALDPSVLARLNQYVEWLKKEKLCP